MSVLSDLNGEGLQLFVQGTSYAIGKVQKTHFPSGLFIIDLIAVFFRPEIWLPFLKRVLFCLILLFKIMALALIWFGVC